MYLWGQPDGRACLQTLEVLGNPPIELDFHVRREPFEAIRQEVERGNLRIASVHNFNPKYVEEGRRYNTGLADLDETSRAQSIKDCLYSLNIAAEFGVRQLVMPLGRILPEIRDELTLRAWYADGYHHHPEFNDLMERVLEERASRVIPHLDAARRSLDVLAPRFLERGVTLCIENRFEFGKLPLLSELKSFMQEYPDVLGYCHDFGHAQVLHLLGLWPAAHVYLPCLPVAIWHICDVDLRILEDHLPLGEGSMNLKAMARSIRSQGEIGVVELRSQHPTASVKKSMGIVFSWLQRDANPLQNLDHS
jgi:sugar phosphate isomerase/epimerase